MNSDICWQNQPVLPVDAALKWQCCKIISDWQPQCVLVHCHVAARHNGCPRFFRSTTNSTNCRALNYQHDCMVACCQHLCPICLLVSRLSALPECSTMVLCTQAERSAGIRPALPEVTTATHYPHHDTNVSCQAGIQVTPVISLLHRQVSTRQHDGTVPEVTILHSKLTCTSAYPDK
jgi:hypothetical protein